MTIGSGGSFCKANNWGEVNAFAVRPDAFVLPISSPTLAPSNVFVSPHFSEQPLLSSVLRIGINVWIGVGVTVLKGVANGANAMIGGGVVVTRDVVFGAKVAGVLAFLPVGSFNSAPWARRWKSTLCLTRTTSLRSLAGLLLFRIQW
jgi:hypothetical protein